MCFMNNSENFDAILVNFKPRKISKKPYVKIISSFFKISILKSLTKSRLDFKKSYRIEEKRFF